MKENNYLTHGIHSYHAKFIPEVPNEFIKKYSKEGDYVLDPFCGSGTTLLEALLLKRYSVGVDLNNIAYKITLAKISRVSVTKLDEYYNDLLNKYYKLDDYEQVDFENKNIWFDENVSKVLDKLIFLIKRINDKIYKNIFEVIFSSILKTVSNKRKVWNNGYIADKVLPNVKYTGDTLKVFESKYKKVRKSFAELEEELKNNQYTSEVFLENILNYLPEFKFDLVVTSPPYPFAVDFVKYNRLTYYWFGWDVDAKAEEETGSRTKRSRKNASEQFFKEMEIIYKHIFSLIKKNGYFCMTVADTYRQKEKVSFVEWLYDIFQSNGWILVSDEMRDIQAQSMAQKRIQKEHKLVFKKVV